MSNQLYKSSHRRYVTLGVLLVSLWAGFCLSGCKPLQEKLDRYLTKAQEAWRFSGSVLVAWDGQVILNKGYGFANRTIEDPNTPNTKFYIGSITKQFTAAAILKLRERGQLHVDDPITYHLSHYPAEPGDRITIHHLLTHTSGIPNYTDRPDIILLRDHPIEPMELIGVVQNLSLLFEPGRGFEYSNSGYVILGAIIEAVSGQSYEAFLHHEILKPLGMLDTGYGRREAAHPQRANGYTLDRDREVVDAVRTRLSILHSAGALYSTVEDMLRWDQALYEERILSTESVDAMLTPHHKNYGYGWVIDTLFGRRRTSHGGFLDGFNCVVERWVDNKLCVVVFTNEDYTPTRKIARGLAAICFGQPYDQPMIKAPGKLDPNLLDDYEGVYRVSDDLLRSITARQNELYLQTGDGPMELLAPETTDRFFFTSDNTTTISFMRNDAGEVVAHILLSDGEFYRADKLDDADVPDFARPMKAVPVDPRILDELVGSYRLETTIRSVEIGFELMVTRSGNHLLVSMGLDMVEHMYPHSESEFFHREVDFYLTFERNDSGHVTGCVLRMGNVSVRGSRAR